MKPGQIIAVGILWLLTATAGRTATVTWDGGGGSLSWQNATNWSGNVLPGAGDDVTINVGSSVTITSSASVTIRSLQCSNHLALAAGTFRVIAGESVVQGQLVTSGNPVLSATGALTSFTVVGPVTADGAGFEATGGATLSLPQLSAYAKGASCVTVNWQATGTNSALDFPGLATITGAACVSLNLQALSGGKVLLTNLTTINDGALFILADGAGSRVDLPVLQQSLATTRIVSCEARNSGTVSFPLFTGGAMVTVALSSGGVIPVTQLLRLNGFSVTGLTLDFPALTNLTGGNLTVSGGAVVAAPSLLNLNLTGCPASTWLVTGTNSVLDFSHLASLTGPGCGFINLQATAGGTMVLSNLTTIAEGTLNFLADGTNSLLDLSALQQMLATVRPVTFEARNRGTVWMPLLTGGPTVSVTLNSSGVLPVAQLRRLNGFTVTGMTVDFPALTNLNGGSITVSGGGVATLPGLQSLTLAGCPSGTWLVTGANSVLDLSHLANVTGPGCGFLNLQAKAGGTMVANNLTSIVEGTLNFLADGANSLVDLGALQQMLATARLVTFEARNSGTVWLPLLTGGPTVSVNLSSSGVMPVAQMRRLNGFAVSGMGVDFPALTNLAGGDITVDAGAVVTATNFTSHSQSTGCFGNVWLVSGAGSVLDFSHLMTLNGAGCGALDVQAKAGGTLILSNLPTIVEGNVSFLADGANSRVDLGALQQSQAALRSLNFEARNSGTVWLPLFPGGPTVTVTIKSGGVLPAAQLRQLNGFTVSAMTMDFAALTNLTGGYLTVDAGAVVTASNLTSHSQNVGCFGNTWLVSGTDSLLDLSHLTNLNGAGCGAFNVQATAGGTLILSNLPAITEGTLSFVADGTNSLVDLRALQQSLATQRTVAFEVRNAGTIQMPLMTGGATVNVTFKTNGVMHVAALGRLSGITVNGMTVNFPALTNFDSGFFSLTNAATVTVPNLRSYVQGTTCAPDAWVVGGAGSVLDLSGITQLTGGTCAWLDLQAFNGGHLLLGNLTNILSGNVYALASGAGSLIDLHSLANFLNAASLSKLTATNGGDIVLNSPFLLSGVTLNIAAGTPGLSAVNLAGTNLVLRGNAWRSYWVEQRDTTSPANEWMFLRRVPLTNEFQIIAPRALANREFRAGEFVADPFLLDLTVLPNTGVVPVLYGPTNHTFDVQATTNLSPPVLWEPFATVSLTNTFRIFPLEPLTTPRRFYKVNEL